MSVFQAGGALPANHPSYTLREEVDNAALVALSTNRMLNVIAPRQVGKTSLLHRLKYLLSEEGWQCAFVDLSLLIDLSMADWYTELGNMLAYQLTPEHSLALTNHIGMRQYLIQQALVQADGKRRVALLFDEVESAARGRNERGQPFSDSFFMTLRNLYNERYDYEGDLAVALAGAVNPVNLVKDQSISPFNVGLNLSLEDFTQAETRGLTEHLSRLGVIVSTPAHQAIYTWTNGHPYLTQRICIELEQEMSKSSPTEITVEDVERTVRRVFLQVANPLSQDSNLRHTSKMLQNLPEPAQRLWQRIQKGEVVTLMNADMATFQDLSITGALKAQDGHIVVRNRIYEGILLRGQERKEKRVHKQRAVKIYYCYDDADRKLKNELAKHLGPLKLSGRIAQWDRWEIPAGAEREREMENHLNAADIVLLLISSDFVRSEDCQREMQLALDRYHSQQVNIIPILLRSVGWEGLPIAKFQALPKNRKPITMQDDRDAAFQDVAAEIERVVESFLSQHPMPEV
ncbi:MAG TPA: AAA-like domain-containing protein [Ktedonobacteraceae bacterium]|nr:AAA-like domain-containing protein [Ktedonobacteraceae bacterium]